MVACKIPSLVILLLVTANSVRSAETKPDEQFRVTPNKVVLDGNFARVQFVVEKVHSDPDRSKDITSRARFVVSDPQIATVSKSGRLVAVGDGATTVTVSHKGQDQRIAIRVSNVESTSRVGFSEHIVPILSKAGCNMGACHASQHGKGGFKLSVFGFDPKNDWQAIVRQDRQRRITSSVLRTVSYCKNQRCRCLTAAVVV